jgi:hypothetical protein
VYTSSEGEVIKNANTVKECVLQALERDGLLTKPAAEIGASYVVVVHRQGWLGRLFKRPAGLSFQDENGQKEFMAVDVFKSV